jgi:shikimate dehydrogenase
VLLIGCGGVGRMMATECILQGAELTIVERDLERAQALSKELEASDFIRRWLESRSKEDPALQFHPIRVLGEAPAEDFDLLMNATPVGMYPKTDAAPVDLRRLPGLRGVIDIIYNPPETRLMRQAREMGLPACNGLYMLVAQGWKAAERFLGEPIPAERAEKIYRELSKK